jgi:hypothetical protein
MKIDEHKAILTELNSETIEPARKLELLSKLETDYSLTQAEITTTVDKLTATEKEKNHFAELSQKLWLENSATLTDINNNKDVGGKKEEIQHQAKRTFESLASKF